MKIKPISCLLCVIAMSTSCFQTTTQPAKPDRVPRKIAGKVTVAGAPKEGVLVHVENASSEKPEKLEPMVVEITNGELGQSFVVIQIDQPLIVKWKEGQFHDILITSEPNPTPGLPFSKGRQANFSFRKPDLHAKLGCAVSMSVRGNVSILGNRFFAFCDRNGIFTLEVPPGPDWLDVVAFYPGHSPVRKQIRRDTDQQLELLIE